MNKLNINFITYGDKNYTIQKNHLLNLARISGNFNKIVGYSFKDLDKLFVDKYSNILNQQKGAGYWIWKHQIIKQALKEMDENSILIYSDAGSSFNLKGQKRFDQYIEMLNESPFSMIRFKNSNIEKYWTSKEIFNYFNLDIESKFGNTEQYLAGHLIIKNNKDTIEQLHEFEKVISYDVDLITDKYINNQISGFKQNRHDQSIFSLISKKYGCVELENEVWFKDNPENQYKFPFLAVQRGPYSYSEKLKFYLFYKKHLKQTYYFGKDLYFYQKPSIIKKLKYKLKNL
tara:strand:- start:261 stop:1124 length:864 start_codon:yes stop_codon:yes gene_type:complete